MSIQSLQPISADPDDSGLWDDDLRNGIWPRSFVIWVVAFWMGLLVIRPWETLLPELAALRVERSYAIFAIAIVSLSGRVRVVSSLQTAGILVWALSLTISAVLAYNRSAAWDALYVLCTLFIFYFILVSVVRTRYELGFLVICFVAVVCLFLGKSQWEHFVHGSWSFNMGVRRMRGMNETFAHPNSVAYFAVMTLPFLSFLWRVRLLTTATWPSTWRRLFPWAIGVGLCILLTSIQLTNSRAGMLGVILFALLWTMGHQQIGTIISRLLVAVIVLAVIWTLMPETSKGRFRNIWDPESGPAAESAHGSAEGRIVGFQQGIEMFRRFPLTGVGPGNFIAYRVSNLDGVRLAAHNTIGGVLGETGTLGGVGFGLVILGIFFDCSMAKRMATNADDAETLFMKQLAVACRNSVILLLFLGMFGDIQGRAQLYWVAAFCSLGRTLAQERILMVSSHR